MNQVTKPHHPALKLLCQQLTELAPELLESGAWVQQQLQLCGQAGVFRWFADQSWGGLNWSESELVEGYLALASACMTTTFVITQRTAASRRIEFSQNDWVRDQYMPALTAGEIFATVGISHLTTSRRHLAQPVLRATYQDDAFILNGYSPWVTGGAYAEVVVVGATLPDGEQILLVVPNDLPGISHPQPPKLVALSASQTGEIHFDNVRVDEIFLLAGPHPQVMTIGSGGGTGGLQTSTLAVGLAKAATEYITAQSELRDDFVETASAMQFEWQELRDELWRAADESGDCSKEVIRTRANSLALRSSQAALAIAKGAGFLDSHPAGRWCREALFFLVWSCPLAVTHANLCELAGIDSGE
jgi:alkylation response protein AidB-like acyl-CoA dehydrogenase